MVLCKPSVFSFGVVCFSGLVGFLGDLGGFQWCLHWSHTEGLGESA